jgi:hypothetical protein
MKILLFTLVFLLSSCSGPKPVNAWKYEATASLNDYSKHYFHNHLLRAKVDLAHARESALHSANLSTLIDIELTVCALKIASLEKDTCEKAYELLLLEPKQTQSAYLHFFTQTLTKDEIDLLPSAYQDFAQALLEKRDFHPALSSIKSTRSRALASALVINDLQYEEVKYLVNRLSYHGYKKPLLAWLKILKKLEDKPKQKKIIEEKIKILTPN